LRTDARPEQVKPLFRRAFIIGRRFRLVHVHAGAETIEVSTFRAAQGRRGPTSMAACCRQSFTARTPRTPRAATSRSTRCISIPLRRKSVITWWAWRTFGRGVCDSSARR
jgi:hypothetical protein